MTNIVILCLDGTVIPFLESDHVYTRMTERHYRKLIPGFRDMTAKAQERHMRKWMRSNATTVRRAESTLYLPNTHKRLNGNRPTQEDYRSGASAFLGITELFQSRKSCYLLICDMLCGQRATALHDAEPSFHAALSINGSSPQLEECLRSLVDSAVTRKRWKEKRCKIRRTPSLDYSRANGALKASIIDHSRIKVTGKGIRGAKMPFPYTDTVALVKDASSSQLREAAPYLENAAVILLNCASGEFSPTRLPPSEVAAYDPEVLGQIQRARFHIAALLRFWWSSAGDEDVWAREIIAQARQSFGSPDGRYIRCELDPKLLRDAIRYRVFLSFLKELETHGIMGRDALYRYREEAKSVFDPAPAAETTLRQADQPQVFLDLMRGIVERNVTLIVGEDARFVKAERHMAAWRVISKERCLVFPEAHWAKAYKQAARGAGNVDFSYFQKDGWELELQKVLCKNQLIKQPSSGFRYRYDLFGNGSRDKTYVVAIPAELLQF